MAALSVAGSTMETSSYLFSWPLLSGTLLLLSAVREGSKRWALGLPLLLAIWASTNGEVTIGLVFIGGVLLDGFVRLIIETVRRRSVPRFSALEPLLYLTGAVSLFVAILILFVPGGGLTIQNPLRPAFLMNDVGVAGWAPATIEQLPLFFIVAVLAAALIRRLPLKEILPEALTLVGLAASTLISAHFVILFAAVVALPAARSLDDALSRLGSSSVWIARRVVTPSLALIVGLAFALPRISDAPRAHPFAGSMRVVTEQGLSGPLFNHPAAGGLAGWKGGAEILPFSDLQPQTLERYKVLEAEGELLPALEAQETKMAAIGWDFARTELEPELMYRAGFHLVHFDDFSLLYARPEANPDAVSGLALYHFNPLIPPASYPPEIVPLVIRELADYLESRPPSVRGLTELGCLFLIEQRKEEALEAFEAARELSPDHLDTLTELSRLYLEKGMYRLAERTSRHGFRLSGKESLIQDLALALYGQGRNEEAAEWFEATLKNHPDNLAALHALVDIYQQLEKHDLALERKRELDYLEETTVKALLDEAETKKESLDFGGAAEAYQKAHEIHPGDSDVLWELALALLTQNDIEATALVLRELLVQDGSHQLALLTLGSLCATQLDCAPGEARRHLEMFLELAPEDINARLARNKLAAIERTNR
jgi:cytochrome c-type biogenesis protein CcmH/NrfG